MKENKIMQVMKNFVSEEDGVGVVEIILILVNIRGIPKLCKYCLMQRAFR